MSCFCFRLPFSRRKKGGEDAKSEKNAAGSQPGQDSSRQVKPPPLAQGDTTRTLFSATSTLRQGQLQGPALLATPPGGTAGASAGRQTSPGSLPSAFMRTATEFSGARGPTGRFTPTIPCSQSVASATKVLPKSAKVVFSRLTDVPVNREGDAVEDRTFFCSVYFDDEAMTKAIDSPSRVTQPAEGFYSGIKHYAVPLNNQSIVLQVPSGTQYTGVDPLTGEERTPPSGFRVALTEQLASGNQIYKGSTPLLRFEDMRLTQMSRWPLVNPVFRQGAGSVYLRCEFTYEGDPPREEPGAAALKKMETAPHPYRPLASISAPRRQGRVLASASACPLSDGPLCRERAPSFPSPSPPSLARTGATSPSSQTQAALSPSTPRSDASSPAAPLPRPANLPPLRSTPRPVLSPERPQDRSAGRQTPREASANGGNAVAAVPISLEPERAEREEETIRSDSEDKAEEKHVKREEEEVSPEANERREDMDQREEAREGGAGARDLASSPSLPSKQTDREQESQQAHGIPTPRAHRDTERSRKQDGKQKKKKRKTEKRHDDDDKEQEQGSRDDSEKKRKKKKKKESKDDESRRHRRNKDDDESDSDGEQPMKDKKKCDKDGKKDQKKGKNHSKEREDS
ncbi:hypothetical protein BESB_054980 [Besnoitia besnoiti]|uniref:Uncharacterized protein n=1 Tax=Besnoitia besnoiti TaxID=94643 RepID=A0A2A9MJS1_BESBE|nr:hypothetical protein BESB_054980 [Besnoitia besnoiti]PFH35847.1 hypothetical protein BESB_054980 [Besnoitia besnoiti]